MPTISSTLSDIIKRRLFRAREHLQCVRASVLPEQREAIELIAGATYEFNRALRLPAVKHVVGPTPLVYLDDAVLNFTTVIDLSLVTLEVESDAIDELLSASKQILTATQRIPLPAPVPA